MASLLLASPSMASQPLSLSLSASHSFSLSTLSLSSSSPSSSSLSFSGPTPSLPSIYCGRGDRKTAKGKRFNHSFGNARPRNKNNGRGPPKAPSPPAAPKKDPFDSGEVVKIEITDE